MKLANALALALTAVAVSATEKPARVEARATNVVRSASLPTITTKGNAFYKGDDRFYIIGIDYQPAPNSKPLDPLADTSICGRDIPYFQKLGVNTIRVYAVDNSVNHDACMNMLAEAGIYLVLDVNNPLYSLDQDAPAKSYNPTYLQSVFATIDAFVGYTNTLGFLSGNEVINSENTTFCAPYVKAVTRDMKQYIGERGFRKVPVGYSAADVSQNQYTLAQYLDCGSSPSRADFYALNNYEWCDPSSLQISGWNTLADQYANYSLPVFMSEYGCIKASEDSRTWAETDALYSSTMTKSFSGGLAFEYSQEGNNYGVVTINGNTVTEVPQQFTELQNAISNIQLPSGDGGAHGSTAPQPCPGQSNQWDTKPFLGEALPATPSGALQYFKNGAGKGPGLNGKGSVWETGGSSSTASKSAGVVTQTYGNGNPNDSGASSSSSGAASTRAEIFFCGAALALSVAVGALML